MYLIPVSTVLISFDHPNWVGVVWTRWHNILTVIDCFDIRSKKENQVVRLRQPRNQEHSSVRFLCVPTLSVRRQTTLTQKKSWCWSTCCIRSIFLTITPPQINDVYSVYPKMIRVKRKLKKLLMVCWCDVCVPNNWRQTTRI